MMLSARTILLVTAAFALLGAGCDLASSTAMARTADPGAAASFEAAVLEESATPKAGEKAAGEKAAGEKAAGEKAAEAPSYHYSPFVVRIHDDIEFQTISFKDVGLKRKDLTPSDPLLEILAQSLSYEMGAHRTMKVEAEVSYDPSLLDPNNHTFCGTKHIYVDVWRKDSQTWGYSLWSGCGEEDNFEWREVVAPAIADLPARVAPLTKSIAASLAAARQSHCFQKSC